MKNLTDKLDILVIDDEVDRMNVQQLFESEGVNADIHEALDCSSGIAKMKPININCILIFTSCPMQRVWGFWKN